MLLLNPREVTFGSDVWLDVSAVAIDRVAAREAFEWGDAGPHVVFADVPEQRVTVTVRQHVARDSIGVPRPGERAELAFRTSPAGADTPRERVRAECVVLGVSHELSIRGGAIRVVKLTAISSDGAADPVTVDHADGGGQG